MQKGTGSTKSQTLYAIDAALIACKWCNFIHLPTNKNYIYSFFLNRKNIFVNLHLSSVNPYEF